MVSGICLLSGFTPNQEAERRGWAALPQRALQGLTAWWQTLLVLRTSEASPSLRSCPGVLSCHSRALWHASRPIASRAQQPSMNRVRQVVVTCPRPHILELSACFSLLGDSEGCSILFVCHLSIQFLAHSLYQALFPGLKESRPGLFWDLLIAGMPSQHRASLSTSV